MKENQTPMNQNHGYVEKSLEVTIKVGLIIGLIVWCFMIMKPFLMLILWSVIISVAIYPLYELLNRFFRKWRIISAILVTLLLLMVIVIPVALLGSSLGDAVSYVKDAVSSGKSLIPPPSEEVKNWPVIGTSLYELWLKSYQNIAEVAVQYKEQIASGASWFLGALSNAGLGIIMFLLSIVISGILLFYSEAGSTGIRRIAERLMGDYGKEMVGNAEVTVRNVARGILGVAFIQAFLCGIGFLVAGIPGAGFWALICFVLAIVQIGVMPVVIGVLIYAFAKLTTLTAVLLLVWCIIPLTIDNILKPLLMGRNAPVPMLVVFLGAIGGFISFGTIGLFVGAVVLSLGYDLFRVWLATNDSQE